jgi:polysaccharide biosynthesis/export protein
MNTPIPNPIPRALARRVALPVPPAARPLLALVALLAAALLITGCETAAPVASGYEDQHSDLTLREGDVIRVSFPGAPNLDVPQQPIRRDGKISLPLAGEMVAAGETPAELQDKILKQLADQLTSKEVIVTVVSSSFSVFVDGTVLRPGKIVSDHPMTVLEAVMEAGGFEYAKADTRHVLVIRHKTGDADYERISLDLQNVLDGRQKSLFYLEPGDVVHVPEKFAWF